MALAAVVDSSLMTPERQKLLGNNDGLKITLPGNSSHEIVVYFDQEQRHKIQKVTGFVVR
jgi:hypothetical protein